MWIPCGLLVVSLVASTYGQYDVRKPPTIRRNPVASVIYRTDDSVTLECKAEGAPAVSYEWRKNTFDLNPNQPNIERGADGTITISKAAASDEGYYQCFARNQFGTAISTTAHIQRAVLQSLSSGIHQKTVQEGMPFHIQADPRKSFPKPIYGWQLATGSSDRNPVPLRPSRRIQIADNGDLYFAYALPEDALDGKLYGLTTYNPYLDVVLTGGYTRLTVTRSPAGLVQFAPTIGFASAQQTVAVVGGTLSLRCFFSGYPEPTISWSGPRNTLPIGRYSLSSFNTELTIINVTASDEGGYTCRGSNTHGSNVHTLEIRVGAVPKFLTVNDGPHDVNVTEGESFTFNCNAAAKPEATIVWFQDGQPLDVDNPPRRFAFSNNKKILTIRDVCRNCDDRIAQTDLMVIQCNASNMHGYAFGQGYLNVLKKTEVTIHNAREVTVNTNKEGRVEFDCRATTDPSTPPTFRWFKVGTEGDQFIFSEPPFLTVNAGLLSIHVAANAVDKWPKYLGQYRCVVDTGHSRVNQTATVNPSIIVVPSPETDYGPRIGYACEGDNLKIECTPGLLIRIMRANYGRLSRAICNDGQQTDGWNLACMSSRSLRIVSEMCDLEPWCIVPASNTHFGDTCSTTFKYLEVEYNCARGSQTPRPVPQPRPASVPTRVLAYLRDANKANKVFPQSGLRPSSGLIYEAPSFLSRRYIATMRLWIPAKFAGIYSVTVCNPTKSRNISDAMDACFREAELSGPSLLLVGKMDTLYPKASASDLGRKADVERLLQVTTRTLRSTFVLFIGFVDNLNHLNPALIQSGMFGRA